MHDLDSLGFGPYFAAQLALLDRPDLAPARVSSVHRSELELAGCRAPRGELSGRLRHDLRPLERPTVGDWVAVADAPDRAIVHHVLDRRTLLARHDPGGAGAQAIAANLDVCFIVTSANLDLSPRRIERYLAAIRDGGADAVVVLNKIDLGDDVDAMRARIAAVAAGAPVVLVSAATGDGVDALRAWVGPGRTAGMVGSSGVGKSSLINRLVGHAVQDTRAIRDGDDRGRHTTTRRELIVIPGGGVVVDTPGMRVLELADDGGLDASFADIAAIAARCRFGDCRHDGEPGCAVADALDAGTLDPARLAGRRKLERELAATERRRDPVLAERAKRRWKEVHLAIRQRKKVDPKLRG